MVKKCPTMHFYVTNGFSTIRPNCKRWRSAESRAITSDTIGYWLVIPESIGIECVNTFVMKIFEKVEIISMPTGSWIRSIQLPVGVEIVSSLSKF